MPKPSSATAVKAKEKPKNQPPKARTDYFDKRIHQDMGLTPAQCYTRPDDSENSARYLYPNKQGDICIDLYAIDGEPVMYDKGTSKYQQKPETYTISRLHPSRVKGGNKYHIPGGEGTYPFFPPGLLRAYREKTKLPFLGFTEGSLKAIKADAHGIPMVGLGSITHLKRDNAIYSGVRDLIKVCDPEYLIIVYDADCNQAKGDHIIEGEDLYNRVSSFYASGQTWQQLLTYTGKALYIKPISHGRIDPDLPKGLDDLLVANRGKEDEIADELQDVSKVGHTGHFYTINVTGSTAKWAKYLQMPGRNKPPTEFYEANAQAIGTNPFLYRQARYQWQPGQDDKDGKLVVILPPEAQDYVRVGPDYYKWVRIRSIYGGFRRELKPWRESVIKKDHGDIIRHVPIVESFVVYPDHQNHKPIIDNCLNLYLPLPYEPAEGDCPATLMLMRHIFGDQLEYGLDYVQLLYTRPVEKLPILCLVSNENDTGKGTFTNYLLKEMFGRNMSVIGNAEFSENFNGTYATKLICAIDEGMIEKKPMVEKLKKLSTDPTVQLRQMNKDHHEVDFFCKFIVMSNNVRNFIIADEQDLRYWVRYVSPPEQVDPDLPEKLKQEIPAFLHYLSNRKLHVPKKQRRMWFDTKELVTDALRQLQEANRTWLEKAITAHVMQHFETLPVHHIKLSIQYVQEEIVSKQRKTADDDWLLSILRKVGTKSDGRTREPIPHVSDGNLEWWRPNSATSRYIVTRDQYKEIAKRKDIEPADLADPSPMLREQIKADQHSDEGKRVFDLDLLKPEKNLEQPVQSNGQTSEEDDLPF